MQLIKPGSCRVIRFLAKRVSIVVKRMLMGLVLPEWRSIPDGSIFLVIFVFWRVIRKGIFPSGESGSAAL